MDMTKFASREDPDYRNVLAQLQRWTAKVSRQNDDSDLTQKLEKTVDAESQASTVLQASSAEEDGQPLPVPSVASMQAGPAEQPRDPGSSGQPTNEAHAANVFSGTFNSGGGKMYQGNTFNSGGGSMNFDLQSKSMPWLTVGSHCDYPE